MFDALISETGLNTVLKMEIAIKDYGLNVSAGGSRIAREVMCEACDGFEDLISETEQKIREVSEFFSNGMDELKRRNEEKTNGNDL